MNKVFLMGRLTRDAELRYTNSGKAVATFTVAVDRRTEGADFINCIAWEKSAETIAEYIKKGRKIMIEGRIQTGKFEKEGKTVYTQDVIVERFEFCDSVNKNAGGEEISFEEGELPF